MAVAERLRKKFGGTEVEIAARGLAMAEELAGLSDDRLDAVLCLLQAAWACRQGTPWYGLPQDMDGLEGWIITA